MIVLKDNKAVVISIIIFCVSFACAVTFVNIYVGNQRNIALEKAHYLTEANVSELDRALGSYMQATDTLRMLLPGFSQHSTGASRKCAVCLSVGRQRRSFR